MRELLSTTPTPGDLRAQIARERVHNWRVAAAMQWHPATLAEYLNERRPLPRELAHRISAAIDRVAARAREAKESA